MFSNNISQFNASTLPHNARNRHAEEDFVAQTSTLPSNLKNQQSPRRIKPFTANQISTATKAAQPVPVVTKQAQLRNHHQSQSIKGRSNSEQITAFPSFQN